jgi:DNA modification methylase
MPRSAEGRDAPGDAPSSGSGPAGGSTRPASGRRPTSTSSFGVSRRESHDASGFYSRFTAPEIDEDALPAGPEVSRSIDRIVCGDARDMQVVPDGSVALVVTSPPYFAGKDYETELGEGHVPASYLEYLEMLTEVFAECVRTLEPGGRIAVNVANLGRRPFRSLAADVTGILQDRLRLLLRGEIVWLKQRGSAGSCAWGSFQRPGNPVLRDTTERVVVASKGRFDRSRTAAQRRREGLPWASTLQRDEFMDATLDVWELPAESATRVGHPAPFPVALPERLIQLYTYRGDLVLDPFVGSGSTAVAALRTGRHYVGYDTDADYVAAADERLDGARAELGAGARSVDVALDRTGDPVDLADARARGCSARECAQVLVRDVLPADEIVTDAAVGHGLTVDLEATDAGGRRRQFLVCGGFSSTRPGLRRVDTLLRALGTAATCRALDPATTVVLVTAGGGDLSGPVAGLVAAAVADGLVAGVVDLAAADPAADLAGILGGAGR